MCVCVCVCVSCAHVRKVGIDVSWGGSTVRRGRGPSGFKRRQGGAVSEVLQECTPASLSSSKVIKQTFVPGSGTETDETENVLALMAH